MNPLNVYLQVKKSQSEKAIYSIIPFMMFWKRQNCRGSEISGCQALRGGKEGSISKAQGDF